jgi:iron complex transport system substrate-binding protein
LTILAGPAHAGPRVYSLDQCADQYVLALSPRADIVGLSKRALNADSDLRDDVGALPLRRATTEAMLAVRPGVVIRYWGGDERLVADLRRRGVAVVSLDDAHDFAGVRANIVAVAAALGQPRAGARLIAEMNARLAASRGAWGGRGALYITPAGYTAGGGTLIDATLREAGLTNLAGGDGFHAVRLEALVMHPPSALVLGFFDAALDAYERWSIGRNEALRRVTAGRTLVSLPGSVLGCPAWFSADGALAIARARR